MDSKNVLLSTTLFAAIGLVGCQTINNSQISSPSNTKNGVNQASWGESVELFRPPNDDNLKTNERRIIFFRDAANSSQTNNINIGVGLDNVFQASLKNGNYSEKIICNSGHIINASVLEKNGEVVSYSENFQFAPQTTTYLKVSLSPDGKPVVRQISTNEALSSLRQATRQNHQISRVPSDCGIENQTLPSQPPQNQSLPKEPNKEPMVNTQLDMNNLRQFSVLFDFDSSNLKNNNMNNAALDGMASFIQSYPRSNIILEGHTDSRGPESYNLRLSQNRADRVKGILVDKYGMEPSRLRTIGYGETKPVDTNSTQQGRQNNRRVVATVSQEGN